MLQHVTKKRHINPDQPAKRQTFQIASKYLAWENLTLLHVNNKGADQPCAPA